MSDATKKHDETAVAAWERLTALLERSMVTEQQRWSAADDAMTVLTIRYALGIARMRVRPALEPAGFGKIRFMLWYSVGAMLASRQ